MSDTPQPEQPQTPPMAAPPTRPSAVQYAPPVEEGDATGGVIPYKNVPALIAYYLGIFSFIPLFGLAAFILGIMGLRLRARKPFVRGAVHAWIGIVLGGLTTLLYLLLIGMMISDAAGIR
jgi:hypothetical protein